MKNNIKNRAFILTVMAVIFASTSCKKMLDVKPEDEVDIENAYLTVADADAAVLGIYGKFTNLAKQYIILNELRADLVDVTPGADTYLQEINNHSITSKNPYTNPKQYYDVILNCNDALRGFNKMLTESRMSVEDYNRHYSDIGALRSWIYLQLGIHYGSVPYITQALDSPDDLKVIANHPKLNFDVLLDSLINFTAGLKYNETQTFTYPTGNALNLTIDGNATRKFFITIPILRGDLYLWANDYLKAATHYKIAMDAETSGNDHLFAYRIAYDDADGKIQNSVRGGGQNANNLYLGKDVGWGSLFALSNTNRSWNGEWYWSLPYSIQYATKNKLPELFSKTYGSYLLKPSKSIIDKWNSQMQRSGAPGDPRGMLSYTTEGTDPVVTKFTDDMNSIAGGGQWNIWRAAGLHLRFAEVANRDGKSIISWGLLNNGISNALVPVRVEPNLPPTYAEVEAMKTPFAEPFFFDARDAGATNTGVRMPWSKNTGIRNRAYVQALSTDIQTDMLGMETALINEAALELAFEGQRWSDLLRIAIRRDDPAFLADKVYDKLVKAGNPNASAVQTKLLNKDWYLPFDIYK